MSNSHKQHNHHQSTIEVSLKPHDVVFYIEAECGKILNTHLGQVEAVKDYILHYTNRANEVFNLIMVRNGVKYQLKPTGSVSDYAK